MLAVMALSACTPPELQAFNPTPIPTLIPATMVPSQIEPTATPPRVIESYPAGIPSAAAGQELYTEHCTECHGPEGEGRVPNARDFGDVDYMRGETPLDFYVAITEGVSSIEEVEYEMPAFGQELSSDERWDLVYYVWRLSTMEERLEAGREIYSAFCEECHGPEGRSQILNAADLSDQRFIAQQSPSTLYLSVTRGRGSMPAFQARLSQDERWMVIEYLRTFSYDPQISEAESVETEEAQESTEEALPCAPNVLAQTNPFDWNDAQAIAAGEPIYQRECGECHAEDGTGAIAIVRDFTNPAVQGDLMENPGDYLCIIEQGRNRMPAFEDTLTEEEIWEILTYIASLGE
ncbi:MAG: c-type cytochrome [Candidatus Promineifilaceae bacterium]|nr:c-type cytochrome [Candidatus Promineifilaceae bacterium]